MANPTKIPNNHFLFACHSFSLWNRIAYLLLPIFLIAFFSYISYYLCHQHFFIFRPRVDFDRFLGRRHNHKNPHSTYPTHFDDMTVLCIQSIGYIRVYLCDCYVKHYELLEGVRCDDAICGMVTKKEVVAVALVEQLTVRPFLSLKVSFTITAFILWENQRQRFNLNILSNSRQTATASTKKSTPLALPLFK